MVRSAALLLVLFAGSLALYVATLSPSLNWGDGARLQADISLGESTYMTMDEAQSIQGDGLPFDRLGVAAWDHPLYVMLGHTLLAWSGGITPYRINLLSALAAATAVALTGALAATLARSRVAGFLAASALAVSHTFWFHAVTTEVYAAQAVLMLCLVGLALAWTRHPHPYILLACAFFAGLGMANHIMTTLTLAPLAVAALARRHVGTLARWHVETLARWHVGRSSRFTYSRFTPPATRPPTAGTPSLRRDHSRFTPFLFILGFSPWWIQFIRMARLGGVGQTLQVAFGFPWLAHQWPPPPVEVLADGASYVLFLLYQFTPCGVALGVYGMLRLWRRDRPAAALFGAVYGVHVLFSAGYDVPDRFAFHLPSYVLFALFIGVGVAGLRERWRKAVDRESRGRGAVTGLQAAAWTRTGLLGGLLLLPIPLYALAPAALRAAGIGETQLALAPIGRGVRDALAYFLTPDKHTDDSAAQFGRTTLAGLAPGALVFAAKPDDAEAYLVLHYFQTVEGLRPDVRLEYMLFTPLPDMPAAVMVSVTANAGCRPLYLASLNPRLYPLAALRRTVDIRPQANLFRLLPRGPDSSQSRCSGTGKTLKPLSLDQFMRSAVQ